MVNTLASVSDSQRTRRCDLDTDLYSYTCLYWLA